MATESQSRQKRKSIRFKPDAGTLASLLTDSKGKKLSEPQVALVVEESYRGCSLITLKGASLVEGAVILVKVGKLSPLPAEIRWIKTYEGKFQFLGLAYSEKA